MTGRTDAAPQRPLAAAEALLPAARERLVDYVRHETPTGDPAALGRFTDVLATRYADLGADVVRVPAPTGDHLVARWDGPTGAAGAIAKGAAEEAGHVLLLGHADTVWPVGQLERMPVVDDGERIRGPGTYDMKGGLVVAEMALELLAACGARPSRPVRLVVTADEEVGSPTARPVVEAEAAGAVAALCLEGPRPGGGLKTSRMGSTRVRIEVTGQEAHAANDPGSGVSAIEELVDQLLAVRRVAAAEPTVLCNIGTVAGGGRTNVVAGRAHAEVGMRFPDPATQHRVLDRLAALQPVRPGAAVTVQVLASRPAWAPGGNEALLATVVATGAALGLELTGAGVAGGSDGNLTGALGVPTIDGLGPDGDGAHALHEHILVDSLAQRAALLAALLSTL